MSDVSEKGFVFSIPDVLNGIVNFSKVYVNYGVMEKETTFGIDVSLPELRLTKTLRSRDLDLLPGKVEKTLHGWEKKYQRYLQDQEQARKVATVEERNLEAAAILNNLKTVLIQTLDVHDAVDWDSIRISGGFHTHPEQLFPDGKALDFVRFDASGKPIDFQEAAPPNEPTLAEVKAESGIFAALFKSSSIQQEYEQRRKSWSEAMAAAGRENENRSASFDEVAAEFARMAEEFENEKNRNNQALNDIKARYQEGDARAIEEYCDLVLSNSQYPDYFPRNWILQYQSGEGMLTVEYELPAPSDLPTVSSYKLETSTDRVVEILLEDSERDSLYDGLVYQICIRTLHEIFESDVIDRINTVVFNGFIATASQATGLSQNDTIASVSSQKAEFESFDLSKVDPAATFRHLQGIDGGPPSGLVAIQPIATSGQTEKRYLS